MHKHRNIPILLLLWLYVYGCVWIMFRLLCRILSPFVRSIAKQINGRTISNDRFQKISVDRDKFEKAIIFYCSSAGEYEQAKPLIDKMRVTHYVHIFFFSISGYRYAQKLNEQSQFDLVPIDTLWDWKKIFNALRPDACIIVRHEFWPSFVACAYKYSKVYAIDVSIREQSSRLSLQTKRWLFACFDLVFFVSERDVQLMAWESHQHAIAGNTKFERVLQRKTERKDAYHQIKTSIDSVFPQLKKLIIGSAWEEDIETALNAFLLLPIEEQINWRIIIVPHDVEEKMIQYIIASCERKNISHQVYGTSLNPDREVLIIAEVGILFELYGCSDAALIGGGFKQGVHNIIEPAVYSLPMVSGPITGSDREAYTYQKNQLLATVNNAQELADWWLHATHDNEPFKNKLSQQMNSEFSATASIIKTLLHTI